MTDTGTCPHCNEQFDVSQYGHSLSCPHCGGSIDVMPEPKVWLETRFGTIGIAGNLADFAKLLTLWLVLLLMPALAMAQTTDTKTGLIWQQSYGSNLTWQEAVSYCDQLQLDGCTDWRLPTRAELISTIDYSRAKPACSLSLSFPTTQSITFWSQTEQAANESDRAWYIEYIYGVTHHHYKSYAGYARCVRGESPNIASAYTDNGDGTVTDTVHGLMWQKYVSNAIYSFRDGATYCFFSHTGNNYDWRVPTISELVTTIDETKWSETSLPPLVGIYGYQRAITREVIPYCDNTYYTCPEPRRWVVTTSGCTWLAGDDSDNYGANTMKYVRCVRTHGTPVTPEIDPEPYIKPKPKPTPVTPKYVGPRSRRR